MIPQKPPSYQFHWPPSPSPSPLLHNLSPPLIAMLAVLATALLILLYSRLISPHIRALFRATSPQFPPSQPQFSPPFDFTGLNSARIYFPEPLAGLSDSTIKTLPLSIFTNSKSTKDCAVCLFEFNEGNRLRTLPLCGHAFHVECIDVWLRSRPSCPLCRTSVSFGTDSPFISMFTPMRAARTGARPSLDDIVVDNRPAPVTVSPIFLKRSYSFEFERGGAASSSPAWRVRRRGIWNRRWQSPFGRRWGRVSGTSRLRCGDPEALLSPERFDRR